MANVLVEGIVATCGEASPHLGVVSMTGAARLVVGNRSVLTTAEHGSCHGFGHLYKNPGNLGGPSTEVRSPHPGASTPAVGTSTRLMVDGVFVVLDSLVAVTDRASPVKFDVASNPQRPARGGMMGVALKGAEGMIVVDIEHERRVLRRRLLGFSLLCAPTQGALDLGRDLVLAPERRRLQRDFALIEGMDNLGQALAIALTTPLGGDVFNIDFGFDGLNAIAVESIAHHGAGADPDRRHLGAAEGPASGAHRRRAAGGRTAHQPGAGIRALDVKVVFETVTGDTATLDLGKVVRG